MTVNLTPLNDQPRLLIESQLKPAQGSRFQPTGFPDLGAATFQGFDDQGGSVDCLLVESSQSMANRLEEICWNEGAGDLVDELKGLPYVTVRKDKEVITNSLLEAHRLASGYIQTDKAFVARLKEEISIEEVGRVDLRKLAKALLKYDVNSLLHGVFLAQKELAGGRLRLPRLVSSFIEAEGCKTAESGGVKRDDYDPKGDTGKTLGNVIYHRTEFTAAKITAFFNIDLAQLRAYGLGDDANNLLTALALYKIQALLHGGLRLRTACDLDVIETTVTRPTGFQLPSREELKSALPGLIQACQSKFADPAVTEVVYKK